MGLVIFAFCVVLGAVSGKELPSFLKKCSLSGDVGECIKNNGNQAIKHLLREGEPLLNAPKATPLHILQMVLPGNDFIAVLTNIELEGLENTTITNMRFSTKVKTQVMNLTNPVLVLSADYSISDNDFFFPSVRGGGQLKMFLDDNTFYYYCDMSRTTRDGEVYIKLENLRVDLTIGRIRYNFSPLYANNADYLNFLNNHKQLVDERIRPAVEKIILNYMATTILTLVDTVPLYKIFDK